jgi:hypothetical protein
MAQPVDIVEWFKWLYDNGILAFTQAFLVVAGLFFAGNQLRLARRSFQATVVSQIGERSSQLQWEVIKDPELRPLLGFPSATEDNTAAIGEYKRALVSALILNHFAGIFDLWQLGGMPNELWDTFEIDLRRLVSRPEFNNRWSQLKRGHHPKFVRLVDWLIAEKASQ